MQTFLPYPDYVESARVLDTRRLGKQIIEARQIGRALTVAGYGWQSHPAVRMWRGYVPSLIRYAYACATEWNRRRPHPHRAFANMLMDHSDTVWYTGLAPPWLGDEAFHSAMRAALLAKDSEWYGQFGWTEEPVIDYVWPTNGLLSR